LVLISRKEIDVKFQSENGVLGMDPSFEGDEDADIINAGKNKL
jgi:acyl CoA:acetate/3-ketoacid CoA transferase beta subunit